jgi:hypothetical protein
MTQDHVWQCSQRATCLSFSTIPHDVWHPGGTCQPFLDCVWHVRFGAASNSQVDCQISELKKLQRKSHASLISDPLNQSAVLFQEVYELSMTYVRLSHGNADDKIVRLFLIETMDRKWDNFIREQSLSHTQVRAEPCYQRVSMVSLPLSGGFDSRSAGDIGDGRMQLQHCLREF